MKKIIILLVMLTAFSAYAAEYSAVVDKPLFISVMVPAGKLGGGDFYNLRVDPPEPDTSIYEAVQKPGGMEFTFHKPGLYKFNIVTNHITKTTCASVHVDAFKTFPVTVRVSP